MKNERIGLFTGTFDPVTNGHIDIIERASQLFDKVYIGIFRNETKNPLFTVEERAEMLKISLADLTNVEIITHDNDLTVNIAKTLGVTALIRSIRNNVDLEYEKNMIYFNREMTGVETIVLVAKPELESINSTRMRELYHFGQDVSQWVPAIVVQFLNEKKSK